MLQGVLQFQKRHRPLELLGRLNDSVDPFGVQGQMEPCETECGILG